MRVHRLPEALVTVGSELAITCEVLEGLAFQYGVVAGQVVEEPVLKDEETTVDPTRFGLPLLGEFRNPLSIKIEGPKRAGGRTAVTVAILPCASWKARRRSIAMSATPSP